MNNIDLYKLKYSKYKSKYLELKQKNLEGGVLPKVTGHVGFYMDPQEFDIKYNFHERKIDGYIHGVKRTRSEWEIHKNEDKEQKDNVNLSFDELCKMSLLVIPLPKRNINEPANPKEWIIPTKGRFFSSWKEKKCDPPISMAEFIKFKEDIIQRHNNTPVLIDTELNKKFNEIIQAINEEKDATRKQSMQYALNLEIQSFRINETENMDKINNTKTIKNLFLLAKTCLEKKPTKVYFCMFEINRFNPNEIREHEVLKLTSQDYDKP